MVELVESGCAKWKEDGAGSLVGVRAGRKERVEQWIGWESFSVALRTA